MDILLVTAVLRTDNLIHIAKNIVKTFKYETELHPVWVLCFDKFHADVSPLKIKKLEVFLLENNIDYEVFMEGTEGEANYGGALMNHPLQELKKKRYSCETYHNPYVLVLDDDNILSPNLIPFIKKYTWNNENTWWLNMLDEIGAQRFVRKIDRLAYVLSETPTGKYRIIHRCATCDPSQILIRLNTLLAIGGFTSSRMYDFDFMNILYANRYGIDTQTRHQGTLTNIPNKDFYITCYHNGLVTEEMIDKTIKEIPTASYEDSYVRVHVGENNYNVQLTNDELKQVLEICKKHVKEEE